MVTELQEVTKNNGDLLSDENMKNASSLLALMHGKQDSICRVFDKEIFIDKRQLISLNEMICEKLTVNNTSTITTTIDVVFTNKKIITFKTWEEFEIKNFEYENSSVFSVYIQWDFFLKISSYAIPQRHTLSVRISSEPRPSDFFKAIINGGFDSEEEMIVQSCKLMAKVDFINNTLAEELLFVVEKWNGLCENAVSKVSKFNKLLFKNQRILPNISKIILTFTIMIIFAIAYILLINNEIINKFNYSPTAYLFLVFPIYELSNTIAISFGNLIYKKCSSAIKIHIFDITAGDKKTIEKNTKEASAKKEVILFILNAIVALIVSFIFFMIS